MRVLAHVTDFMFAGLVFEDAPAGIRSGKAAGCKVLAVLTTHSRESCEAAGADIILNDFTGSVLRSALRPRFHRLIVAL